MRFKFSLKVCIQLKLTNFNKKQHGHNISVPFLTFIKTFPCLEDTNI